MSNCQSMRSPLCPRGSRRRRGVACRSASSPVLLYKHLVQKMHLRLILLPSQSVAIASAVCVWGKNNMGVTVMPGPPSPPGLFTPGPASYGTQRDPGASFPAHLASSALNEHFCFPRSAGKAQLKGQCRRDALPFPSTLRNSSLHPLPLISALAGYLQLGKNSSDGLGSLFLAKSYLLSFCLC